MKGQRIVGRCQQCGRARIPVGPGETCPDGHERIHEILYIQPALELEAPGTLPLFENIG